jgi:hypothetical protein
VENVVVIGNIGVGESALPVGIIGGVEMQGLEEALVCVVCLLGVDQTE